MSEAKKQRLKKELCEAVEQCDRVDVAVEIRTYKGKGTFIGNIEDTPKISLNF